MGHRVLSSGMRKPFVLKPVALLVFALVAAPAAEASYLEGACSRAKLDRLQSSIDAVRGQALRVHAAAYADNHRRIDEALAALTAGRLQYPALRRDVRGRVPRAEARRFASLQQRARVALAWLRTVSEPFLESNLTTDAMGRRTGLGSEIERSGDALTEILTFTLMQSYSPTVAISCVEPDALALSGENVICQRPSGHPSERTGVQGRLRAGFRMPYHLAEQSLDGRGAYDANPSIPVTRYVDRPSGNSHYVIEFCQNVGFSDAFVVTLPGGLRARVEQNPYMIRNWACSRYDLRSGWYEDIAPVQGPDIVVTGRGIPVATPLVDAVASLIPFAACEDGL